MALDILVVVDIVMVVEAGNPRVGHYDMVIDRIAGLTVPLRFPIELRNPFSL